ncbi:hypothetical protein LT493_26315 [Streptomyces tricolor]|nr:hypothetical protein [Streptomyces tricolor]
MPYLIPSRTPLTSEQVEEGFDYLPALQTGGGTYAAGRVERRPRSWRSSCCGSSRTSSDPPRPGDGESTDPCADSFTLDEVGCVLLAALRTGHGTPLPRRCGASPAASSGSRRT